MNRHLYRIVFNKKRGLLMAVAECATGDGKTAGTGTGAPSALCATLRGVAFGVLLALGMAALIPSAAAQIVAYKQAPSSQRPTVLTAGNGVPLVNIQTPSAAGVSRNTYEQFDVQTQGAILNNARKNTATQIGGWVQGNPWLARGTARVILNEVVSSTPSLLSGYLEVAGDKAQVVIANPAGVTCSGCGFLNASRATLTTGTPILNGGNLDGYRITGGTLRIDGAGLDATGADATDLIARAVEINAGLWAKDLKVTAGANQVDAAHTSAAPIASHGAAPVFAIDVARLGGMYANKIHLVGTEAGVGVRNAGTLGATAGEVRVTVDGRLINQGTVISGEHALTLRAHGIDNAGTVSAGHNLTLSSRGTSGDIVNTGLLHAGRELVLDAAGQLSNQHGTLEAQRLEIDAERLLNDGGTLRQNGTQALAISAGHVANSAGALIGNVTPSGIGGTGSTGGGATTPPASGGTATAPTSAGSAAVTVTPSTPLQLADGRITVRAALTNAGTLAASGGVALTASAGIANAGTLTLDQLAVTGGNLHNSGAIQTTDAHLATPVLDNRGGTLDVARTLTLTADDLANAHGTLRHTGTAAFTLALAGTLDNRDGQIASNALDLALSAARIDNADGRITHAGAGALTLTAGRLDGSRGTLESRGALTLAAGDAVLDGASTVGDTFALSATTLSHRSGHLAQTGQGAGSLHVAGHFDNRGGMVANAGPLSITAGDVDNRNGGRIVSDGPLALSTTTGTLANDGGTISSRTQLTATITGELTNTAGQLVAGDELLLRTGGRVDNTGGTLAAVAGRVDATLGGALDNTRGRVESATTLTLTSHGLSNVDGTVLGQALTIDTQQHALDNTRGTVAADGALAVQSGALTNTGGRLQAGGALTIDTHGQTLLNTGTSGSGSIHGQGRVTLGTGALDNSGGTIIGADALDLTTTGHLANAAGTLATDGNLSLAAHTLTNAGGRISAGQTLQANIRGTLANTDGTVVATHDVEIRADGLDNTRGTLGSVHGHLIADAGTGPLGNAAGRIEAAQNLTLAGSGLTNAGGLIVGRHIAVDSRGHTLDNAGGVLVADGTLDVHSGALNNDAGLIQAAGALVIDTHGQALSNRNAGTQGGVRGQSSVTIAAGAIDNGSGRIVAGQTLALSAQGLDNRLGTLGSIQGGIVADTGSGTLDNTAGALVAAQHLTLATRGLTNTDGRIGGQQVRIDTRLHTLDNTRGLLVADGTLDVHSGALNNHAGLIQAAGALVIDTHGNVLANTASGSDGGIRGQGAVVLRAGSLDNRGGDIEARTTLTASVAGILDNSAATGTAGLIRAGQAIDLAADRIDNRGTRASGRGIQSDRVTLAARHLDNTAGAVQANNALSVTSGGTLDNTAGLLSSTGTLSVSDPLALPTANVAGKTLDIANAGGLIVADRHLSLDAARLTGTGQILGGEDLSVKLTANLDHSGEITANRNARVETAGVLSNRGTLQAGNTLTVQAGTLDNTATGKLAAATLHLKATDTHTLVNRGLIDGHDTYLDAITLNNLGTGRIYGDHVAIAATTLNNLAENGVSPVIAARQRLDLGAATINNRDGALIFSAGDMSLGGALDANHRAMGSATAINNASATIETLGDLSINAGTIHNTNEHLITRNVVVSTASLTEYQGSGAATRYLAGTPGVYIYKNESDHLRTPGGSYSSWLAYRYTRTTTETQVVASDPGKIVAGGAMTINAQALVNDNSRIQAGGALAANVTTLDNRELSGTRTSTDAGTVTSYWRDRRKGRDRTGSSTAAYRPAATIQTISLGTSAFEGNTALAGSGQSVAPRSAVAAAPGATGASAAGTGTPQALPSLTPGSGASATRSAQAPAAGAPHAPVSPLTQVPALSAGPGGIPLLVRTVAPSGALPASRLYHTTPESTTRPLIETDPAFASYRQWLTSDYLLGQLALDPATTQKRLGDGFYEQRLITEQIAQLTGRRFLDGYADDESQYRALMNAGVTVAREWNLIPGIALSDAQMAQLTTDIVWLVEREVTLADGSTRNVLAPQVYARVRDGDLTGGGALIAANVIDVDLTGDLTNSGTIAGRQLVALTAENIANLGGRIAGQSVVAEARQDLLNRGGTLEANDLLAVLAGHDLTVESTTRTQQSAQGRRTHLDRVAGLYVSGDAETGQGGTLVAAAGRDLTLLAAALINAHPTAAGRAGTPATPITPGTTTLSAGRDLTLGTVAESQRQQIVWDSKNQRRDASASDIGTLLQTDGDLTLAAGRDLTATAAAATAGGVLTATAGHDLTLGSGSATVTVDEIHRHKSKGFLSSKTRTTRDTLDSATALSSTFSGETTALVAGRDMVVKGSNIVATNDTKLTAGRHLTFEAATETHAETHFKKTTQSGIFSSGGIGFTIGSKMLSTDQQSTRTTAAASTVGSVEGNVVLSAGETYRQVGSDVIAPSGDIDITAKTVDILEARETNRTTFETKMKQSGLTIAITSPIISAVQTVQQMASAARDTKDSRMQLLAAANIGLAGYTTYDAIKTGQGTTMKQPDGSFKGNQINTGKVDADGKAITRDATAAEKIGGVNLSFSLGSSQSRSKTTQTGDSAAGSTLSAGRDLLLTATGAGAASDLTVQGSDLTAGRHLTLTAEDEIKLLAAANTASQRSTNKSSSASVGFSVGTDGLLFNLGASAGRGKADGDDVAWSNTHLQAGETLTLQSGGDTTLTGALAQGDRIIADIGGDLKIASLQDQSTYASKQKSAGFSLSVGAGRVSGSVSMSQSKVNSDYASVTEQSGLKAGDAGFQVKVEGGTDLKGAVIASSQHALDAGKNRFETGGTLTTEDLQNHAEYKAKSTSVNIGSSLSFDGKLKPGGTGVGFGKDDGKAESTTQAGITGIAGNTLVRTGDPETGIARIFDAEKVQKEIEAQTKITQMFGQQASKAVGDYAASQLKTANDLRRQGREEEAKAIEALWDETGTLRIAAHTVIGGLTGGASGAAGSLAGTITAPLVAEELAKAGINGNLATALTALASTTVGGAVGGSAGAGTALNEVANNFLSHAEDEARHKASKACAGGDDAGCREYARLDALDKQRDAEHHLACDGASSSQACADATRDLYEKLGTFALADARKAASNDKTGEFAQAHKKELQSYFDLIKMANAEIRTSIRSEVRAPNEYDADPYGVVNKDNTKDAYLVMKFGTEALAIANVNENGNYTFTEWAARNGMRNDPSYATGLMFTHVDAAADLKQQTTQDTNYTPVDRYTLSYAPTGGFFSDLWGTLLTKIGIESESVLGLRSQIESIQGGETKVNWVAHSRGGTEFVQAAQGSGVKDLSNNSVVFHAGANTVPATTSMMDTKKIRDVIDEENRYRDAPNDLVPQIVGLRALTSPLNFMSSLWALPSVFGKDIEKSPHTLPYQWNNLHKGGN